MQYFCSFVSSKSNSLRLASSVGNSAAARIRESFENKLTDQVHNYPHLYDVS